jgi:hypothetical protein
MTQDSSVKLEFLPNHGFNGNQNEAIQDQESRIERIICVRLSGNQERLG